MDFYKKKNAPPRSIRSSNQLYIIKIRKIPHIHNYSHKYFCKVITTISNHLYWPFCHLCSLRWDSSNYSIIIVNYHGYGWFCRYPSGLAVGVWCSRSLYVHKTRSYHTVLPGCCWLWYAFLGYLQDILGTSPLKYLPYCTFIWTTKLRVILDTKRSNG